MFLLLLAFFLLLLLVLLSSLLLMSSLLSLLLLLLSLFYFLLVCFSIHLFVWSITLQNVVASGQIGNEPTVHIWNSETKETLSILQTSHSVGVCNVNFSCSGKLLLTVGLDDRHTVVVWRWAEGWYSGLVSQ